MKVNLSNISLLEGQHQQRDQAWEQTYSLMSLKSLILVVISSWHCFRDHIANLVALELLGDLLSDGPGHGVTLIHRKAVVQISQGV